MCFTMSSKKSLSNPKLLRSGIKGLDPILGGGLAPGQPVIVRGASGTGKTIFSLMFAAVDSKDGEESAVYATFDEAPDNLRRYLRTLAPDASVRFLDFRPDPETPASGPVTELGGVLVRLEHALEQTGASRVVLDAVDALFETFGDHRGLRAEMLRVFDWCRQRGVTLLVTAGVDAGYRQGTDMLDYASDCAIHLDQRLEGGLMTRILRVIKCRGRAHGTNEYPYLIASDGVAVMPLTETRVGGRALKRRVSTGIRQLDMMFGGRGLWAGSATMVSGHSGTGKSLIALNMAAAACERGQNAVLVSFEESPGEIVRGAASIGLDLRAHIKSGRLSIRSQRSVEFGLEEHIIRITRLVEEMDPDVLVLDPVTALTDLGNDRTFKSAVVRLGSFLKHRGVTAIFSELLSDNSQGVSGLNISSLLDSWIRLNRFERNGSLVRTIHIHKSRGIAASPDIHEFQITGKGFVISHAHETVATGGGR